MHFEWWISWRYLISRQKERFIFLISFVSIIGVAIGVMALIVVLSVMTGFDRELKDRIIGNHSHVLVESSGGIPDYLGLSAKIAKMKHVLVTSPYLTGQVFLYSGDKVLGLTLKGIEPERESKVTKLSNYIVKGRLKIDLDGILIGKELADQLNINLNDEVMIASPFLGNSSSLKVQGIFHSGVYDYDMNLVFVNLAKAQDILGVPSNIVSGLGIKLDNIYRAAAVKNELIKTIGINYNIRTWIEINRNFFAALRLEKTTLGVILALIVLVASFNILSTLIVMVVEKTKDIGILKAIGATKKQISKIYTLEGLLIGLVGTSLGTGGGIILCYILKRYQFIRLPQDIYFLDRLPVYIVWWPDITLVILVAIAITLFSAIYPASKAARLSPIEALRYE